MTTTPLTPTIKQGTWTYGPEESQPDGSPTLTFADTGIEFFTSDNGKITPDYVRQIALDLMKLATAMSAAGVQ